MALGEPIPPGAGDLDGLLAVERRSRRRARSRAPWRAAWADLPDGTVVLADTGAARLVVGSDTLAFTHAGWSDRAGRPFGGDARVLTPPTSVGALRLGFAPVLHPTASRR